MSSFRHLFVFLILGASTLFADSPFLAKPAGLRLVTAPYEGELHMRPFNHKAGSHLVFTLKSSASGPYIVDIDFDRSTIESASDDTGRDLIAYGTDDGDEIRERTELRSTTPNISSDGRAVLVRSSVFHPLALPAPSSNRINLKATVAVIGASGSKSLKAPLNITPGQSTAAGKLRFELDEINPEGGFGKTPYELKFRVFGPMQAVRDLQVLDDKGNKVPRHDPLQPRLTNTGKEQFHYLDLLLAKSPSENAELRVELWTGLSDYLVPVEIPFTLGLGSDDP